MSTRPPAAPPVQLPPAARPRLRFRLGGPWAPWGAEVREAWWSRDQEPEARVLVRALPGESAAEGANARLLVVGALLGKVQDPHLLRVVHCGVLANKAARADGLGNAQTALYLTRSPDEPGGLPAGRYDLQLAGTLQTLRFSFQVDYAHQPAPASPACSFYPAQPAFDGQLALFCQGLEPARRYTVTASQGDLSESLSTESDPTGFLLFPLHLSSTILTPGEWTFSLDNGLPPMPVQVVPNPEAP